MLSVGQSVERVFGDEPEGLIGGGSTTIASDRFRKDHAAAVDEAMDAESVEAQFYEL